MEPEQMFWLLAMCQLAGDEIDWEEEWVSWSEWDEERELVVRC